MPFKLERHYQRDLIAKIEREFPGAIVLKNDPQYLQGAPDLLLLLGRNWAMLETKREIRASRQPNQDYYINLFNRMSFASFIYPENQTEVLDGIHSTFAPF